VILPHAGGRGDSSTGSGPERSPRSTRQVDNDADILPPRAAAANPARTGLQTELYCEPNPQGLLRLADPADIDHSMGKGLR
jgi:hypothetical protein